MNNDPNFPQLKKDLIDRVKAIEDYISDGIKTREEILRQLSKMHYKIYGDDDANPPKVGFDDRLKLLESVEADRIKLKNSALKLAVGSMTMAVGGAMIWIFNVLRDGFIRH